MRLVATFEDGEALYRVVCERGLEGVVAKRERDPYRPGERGWVKTKNRATARFAEERDGLGRRLRRALSPATKVRLNAVGMKTEVLPMMWAGVKVPLPLVTTVSVCVPQTARNWSAFFA